MCPYSWAERRLVGRRTSGAPQRPAPHDLAPLGQTAWSARRRSRPTDRPGDGASIRARPCSWDGDRRLPPSWFPALLPAVGTLPVPELLRSEVAAFGRISSLGELHAEGIQVEGIPVVGLAPTDSLTRTTHAHCGTEATPARAKQSGSSRWTAIRKGPGDVRLALWPSPLRRSLPYVGALDHKAEGEAPWTSRRRCDRAGRQARLRHLMAFGGGNASPSTQFRRRSRPSQSVIGAIWSISLANAKTCSRAQTARGEPRGRQRRVQRDHGVRGER